MAVIKMDPELDEYQEAENRFLHAIGACVTRWAFIDRQLFALLQWALQTSSERAAFVHYNQPNLKGRLIFVDKLLKRVIHKKEHAKEWSRIFKEIDGLIPTRNVIVHHPLKRTGTAKDGKAVYIYSIYVEPNQRLTKYKFDGFGENAELLLDDLEKHAEKVDAVEARLRLLRKALESVA